MTASDDENVMRELERQLQVLLAPYGGAGNLRDREQALAYLLAHADLAHPRLVEIVRAHAPGTHTIVAMDALARFGREEGVTALETALLHGSEAVRLAAADALARHPSRRALEVLARAARSDDLTIRDVAEELLAESKSRQDDQS
jgi:HEAT repeat protein